MSKACTTATGLSALHGLERAGLHTLMPDLNSQDKRVLQCTSSKHDQMHARMQAAESRDQSTWSHKSSRLVAQVHGMWLT